MQTIPRKLRPALAEVQLARQDQDQILTEVPRRARLDREAQGRNKPPATATVENAALTENSAAAEK